MENQTIKLWAFYYNQMTYESSSEIVSYHRTHKGANEAMRKHKGEARKEFDEMYSNKKEWKPKFGAFEAWYVQKFELVVLD